nr:uncharacterized protein LOC112009872 [Quercus suber]
MCIMKKFEEVSFVQVPREENLEADALVKEASAKEAIDESDEIQYMPSVDIPVILQVGDRENWMAPIVSYLKDGRLPEGRDEARKLRVRAARYILIDEILYKRGFSQSYLRCLAPDEANYVIREIHEGACGNHSGARSLIHKIVRAGYYWPNMQADAKAYVKVCDQCQRFGVPKVLVSDNGRQFDNVLFKDFCTHFGIQNHYSSPAHPQANGQAEGIWPEELPGAYRTTTRTPTGETPFKLAYGTEAVIPAEVHMASHRVAAYQDEDNEEQLRLDLDLIDEHYSLFE